MNKIAKRGKRAAVNIFHYDICTEADKDIFLKQCKALEKHIPNLSKGKLLEDVDGSETQLYMIGEEIEILEG